MAKRVPRASVPGAEGDPAVPGGVSDRAAESGDVVLRLLHTADWHLGRRFPSFPEEAQKKLSRARMDVIARILDVAPPQRGECGAVRRRSVRRSDTERGLLGRARKDVPRPSWPACPDVSRAGQSRPADAGVGVGADSPVSSHGFRHGCTSSTAMISRTSSRRTWSSTRSPCRSKAGENDLAMALPAREPGDDTAPHRLRSWLHVRHRRVPDEFPDLPGRGRAARAGLSGDRRHAFVPRRHRDLPVPTVYPGRPRADELRRAGCRQRRARRAVPARIAPARRSGARRLLAMDRRAVPRHATSCARC